MRRPHAWPLLKCRRVQSPAPLAQESFDTFGPLGPCIATGIDPGALKLRSGLNGDVRQTSNTSLIEPGDVIYTGTPTGVGAIAPGDVMEVEIEGIGVLRNRVVAENGAA
jgi:2-keto-4-pentenoate hydratase/2-oxohepta-3-ene-1,7-dioic acid hydratase in catechol pathway